AGDAINPGGRHVAFGKCELNIVEGAEVHLVAAPALGLQHAKKSGALHVGDGLVRYSALSSPFERTLGERRDHRTRAGDDFGRLGCSGFDVSYRVHGIVADPPVEAGRYSAAARFLRALRSRRATSISVDMISPKVR